MKFSELPVGSPFEFEGEPYVKSAPLIATHARSGKQKFMPRYAVVGVAAATPPAALPEQEGVVRLGQVAAAFEGFYGECLRVLENLSAAKQGAAREALEQARKVFLDSLH